MSKKDQINKRLSELEGKLLPKRRTICVLRINGEEKADALTRTLKENSLGEITPEDVILYVDLNVRR